MESIQVRFSSTNYQPSTIFLFQPPSPKRRGGRNTKSKNSSPVEVVAILPVVEPSAPPQLQPPPSVRSSRRAKKEVEIPVEKQEEIVLNKKPRTGRGKKNAEPSNTKPPLTMVDVVLTSITISVRINNSEKNSHRTNL